MCRWQGTDNCLHDGDPLCRRCGGKKSAVQIFQTQAWDCRGYMNRKKYLAGGYDRGRNCTL
jgi:hypothetical protein